MIKVMSWLKRKPGTDVEDFRTYWREEHPKVVLQLPGLRKYVQNHTDDSGYTKRQPDFDGVAETWWDSRDALLAHRGTDELEALLTDELEFLDVADKGQLVAEEKVVVNGPIPVNGMKQLSFLKRRPDLTIEDAHTYWRETHGPIGAQVPGMRRYVQNHTLHGAYRADREPTYDGCAVVWFDSLDAMREAATSEELRRTRDDEPNFIAKMRLPMIVAVEHHII